MAFFADPECCWCGGFGLDAMTGETCTACNDQDQACDAETVAIGQCSRRRAPTQGSPNKLSLRFFVSDVSAKGKRRRQLDLHAAQSLSEQVANSESPCRRRRPEAVAVDCASPLHPGRSRKVSFNLDIVEYPITPLGKYSVEYETYIVDVNEDTSSDDDDDFHCACVAETHAFQHSSS